MLLGLLETEGGIDTEVVDKGEEALPLLAWEYCCWSWARICLLSTSEDKPDLASMKSWRGSCDFTVAELTDAEESVEGPV